jgi:hypothetical protein
VNNGRGFFLTLTSLTSMTDADFFNFKMGRNGFAAEIMDADGAD